MKQEQNSLTSQQLSELRELFVDRYIDNMSTKDLVEYVYNDMTQYVESQSDEAFIKDCKDYWEAVSYTHLTLPTNSGV